MTVIGTYALDEFYVKQRNGEKYDNLFNDFARMREVEIWGLQELITDKKEGTGSPDNGGNLPGALKDILGEGWHYWYLSMNQIEEGEHKGKHQSQAILSRKPISDPLCWFLGKPEEHDHKNRFAMKADIGDCTFVNTDHSSHLGMKHDGHSARESQVDTLLREMSTFKPARMDAANGKVPRMVVGGDFNTSGEIDVDDCLDLASKVLKGKNLEVALTKSKIARASEEEIEALRRKMYNRQFNWLDHERVRGFDKASFYTMEHSIGSHLIVRMHLDHFFWSKTVEVESVRRLDTRKGSSHFPIWIEIRKPSRDFNEPNEIDID